jgi:hypothetical protein
MDRPAGWSNKKQQRGLPNYKFEGTGNEAATLIGH